MIEEKGIIVHPDEVTETWERVVLSSDIRTFGIHPAGGRGSHERVLDLARNGLPGDGSRILGRIRSAGIGIEYDLHAMSMLLPRELFGSHPEYFRLDEKGERNPDFNCCASNEEALEIVSERSAFLARHLAPSTHRYHLWLDDVRGKCCRCPDCAGLSPSDQAMKICNAVLRGLRQVDPLASESYLAYIDTTSVPEHVLPDDGIFLEFAPFERDFHAPMESEVNASSAAAARDLLSFFAPEKARVLEYWLDNSLFSSWTKPPKKFALDRDVVERDLEFYAKLGCSAVTTFACFLGRDYEERYGFPDLSGYLRFRA